MRLLRRHTKLAAKVIYIFNVSCRYQVRGTISQKFGYPRQIVIDGFVGRFFRLARGEKDTKSDHINDATDKQVGR